MLTFLFIEINAGHIFLPPHGQIRVKYSDGLRIRDGIFYLRNEFHFSDVHGAMNHSGVACKMNEP